MTTSLPEFHLARVFDDGSSAEPQVLPILEPPLEARLSRRQFVGTGVTIASVLAALAGCAAEPERASPKADSSRAKAAPPPRSRAAPKPPAGIVHAHTKEIRALAFTPDGATLVSAGGDLTLKVWAVREAKLVKTSTSQAQRIDRIVMSPDGRSFFSASIKGSVVKWSLPGGEDTLFLRGVQPTAIALNRDGTVLYVASTRRIRSFSAANATELGSLPEQERYIHSLGVLPDDRWLFVGMESNRALILAAVDGAKAGDIPGGLDTTFRDFAILPAGDLLVSRSSTGHLALWTLPDGRFVRRSPSFECHGEGLAISPDGKSVFAGCTNGSIRVVRSTDLGPLPSLRGHQASVTALAVSRDGRMLASGDTAGVIILWDLESAEAVGFLFDPAASQASGITYNVRDSVTGHTITYTMPCGTPIPPNAVCVCNCVPGTYRPAARSPAAPSRPSAPVRRPGGRYCTCDKVCTCVPVRMPCDRDLKTDFGHVDARSVLEGMISLPIYEWRYREEDPSMRHLGPTAQDFRTVFGLGEDDRSIAGIDAHGVAMASIQALHEMLARSVEALQAQAARIEGLEKEVDRLKRVAGGPPARR